MVMRWGMSDKIGNIDYSEAHSGYEGNAGGFSVSAETKRLIEDEVKAIIDEGYARAMQILNENEAEFENLAKGLLEYETLTGDQIRKVMAGEKLTDADDAGTPPAPTGGGTPSVAAIPKTRKPRAPKPDAEPSPL
jgi:cell division protease FtsH